MPWDRLFEKEPVQFMKQLLLFQLRASGQIQFFGVCAQATHGAVAMTAGVAAVLDPLTMRLVARTHCYWFLAVISSFDYCSFQTLLHQSLYLTNLVANIVLLDGAVRAKSHLQMAWTVWIYERKGACLFLVLMCVYLHYTVTSDLFHNSSLLVLV